MKIANVKGMIAKLMMAGVAAGALMIASPTKAQAEVFVGVQAGNPYFVGHDRFAFERRQEFLRHEEWMRAHRFDRRYGYR